MEGVAASRKENREPMAAPAHGRGEKPSEQCIALLRARVDSRSAHSRGIGRAGGSATLAKSQTAALMSRVKHATLRRDTSAPQIAAAMQLDGGQIARQPFMDMVCDDGLGSEPVPPRSTAAKRVTPPRPTERSTPPRTLDDLPSSDMFLGGAPKAVFATGGLVASPPAQKTRQVRPPARSFTPPAAVLITTPVCTEGGADIVYRSADGSGRQPAAHRCRAALPQSGCAQRPRRPLNRVFDGRGARSCVAPSSPRPDSQCKTSCLMRTGALLSLLSAPPLRPG